jgi:hypothetical protein
LLYWGANEGQGKYRRRNDTHFGFPSSIPIHSRVSIYKIGLSLGTNQETPLLIDEDVIDVCAGPRYTLLIDTDGSAYVSGFI